MNDNMRIRIEEVLYDGTRLQTLYASSEENAKTLIDKLANNRAKWFRKLWRLDVDRVCVGYRWPGVCRPGPWAEVQIDDQYAHVTFEMYWEEES